MRPSASKSPKRSSNPFAIALSLSLAVAVLPLGTSANAGSVKGRIVGGEKLVPDVYAEAAKPDAHHYTWREPSPTVKQEFRVLAANPSRDICIAAISSAYGASNPAPKHDPIAIVITGGHAIPSTIVVSPGTILSFQNHDPFSHRLYQVSGEGFKPEEMQSKHSRDWTAAGAGRFEFRDQLFPSIRFTAVVDPGVVDVVYPGKNGAFAFRDLPSGDYSLQAFLDGKKVGKLVTVGASHGVVELKDPITLGEVVTP